MIKVNHIVEQIIRETDFVEHALSNNFLNLTEYARFIQKNVEKRTRKKVQLGSIVVALSRLKRQQSKGISKVKFGISELSIKSPLCEIVYEKTEKNLKSLNKIYSDLNIDTSVFLTITQSSGEIMITINSQYKNKILKLFSNVRPKVEIEELVGISIRLKGEVIDQHGILYTLLKGLAWNKISIVDLVSTYTEFIFIVKKEKVKEAFNFINDFYVSQK